MGSPAPRMFCPFLRAVERYPRMRTNCSAPVSVLNLPETFIFVLIIRMSRSLRLLSNGTRKSFMKHSVSAWKFFNRSSRLRGRLCFFRPRLTGVCSSSSGAGLAAKPASSTSSYRLTNWVFTSSDSSGAPFSLLSSTAPLRSHSTPIMLVAHGCCPFSAMPTNSRRLRVASSP
jgi:hypothetical protein